MSGRWVGGIARGAFVGRQLGGAATSSSPGEWSEDVLTMNGAPHSGTIALPSWSPSRPILNLILRIGIGRMFGRNIVAWHDVFLDGIRPAILGPGWSISGAGPVINPIAESQP